MGHLRVSGRAGTVLTIQPPSNPEMPHAHWLFATHRFEVFDVFEVDLLGYDLDLTVSAIGSLQMAALHRPTYPNSLAPGPRFVNEVVGWVPQRDRDDIDPAAGVVDADSHQIPDQASSRVENPQFAVDLESSAQDNEIEIHDISPLFCSGRCRA
jgi:hypothetical protein